MIAMLGEFYAEGGLMARSQLGNRDLAQVQHEILKNSKSDWADRLFVLLNP